MRKNGFTLIELLAVIVILAIIALIATPIILGIINDAREESNKRSVELYASAIKNAMAAYQLTHTNAPTSISDLDIEYDGNIVCDTVYIYADGKIYVADCTVNGTKVEYTYGEKQITQDYKPQCYYFGFEIYGTVGKVGGPTKPSCVPPTGEIRYLGFDVNANNKITTAYACFVRNGTEYCLKGNDTEAFATNNTVLEDAFADVVDTGACTFDNNTSRCSEGGLFASANSYGTVSVEYNGVNCIVFGNGDFRCQSPLPDDEL